MNKIVRTFNYLARQNATLNGGSGPKDGLVGFTSSTVGVRRGSTIYVYNANGHTISTVNARR